MLSMPFADELSTSLATKKRDAGDAEDGADDEASGASSTDVAYRFEGYQIESSERIMLTPMGIQAATPRPRS